MEYLSWEKRMNKQFFYTLITAVAFFALGLVVGMLLQQANTQATMMKVASSLEGVQIDVNINETLMVDTIMDNFEEMGLFNITNKTNDVLLGETE